MHSPETASIPMSRHTFDTKKRLEAPAKRARRSKSFLAAEAIAAFCRSGELLIRSVDPPTRDAYLALRVFRPTA
jgi:predicted transcriptional regulator